MKINPKIKLKNFATKGKHRFVVLAFFAVATLVLAVSGVPQALAESLTDLRDKSERLEAEIDASEREAAELRKRGDTLQATISGLDNEISQANKQIELYNTRISELEAELKIAQEELERQKDMLKANMRALYKRGGASTVELLVASDSFSQFIDEQEYLERLKVSIQESAERVVALEQKIRAQRDEQKKLLGQEEAAKQLLDRKRAERASILAETRGREEQYRARADRLQREQAQLIAEIVSRSQVISGVGTGAYPWASYREGSWTHAASCTYGDDHDQWGYCYRQCTSYSAWKLYASGKNSPMYYGDATNWGWQARAHGVPTGSEPRKHAIAVWSGAGEGHVAFVEQVLGDGKVRISEYNAVPAFQGRYSERIIYANDPTEYIYFQ